MGRCILQDWVQSLGLRRNTRERWKEFYRTLCRGLHVNEETKAQLDARLDADEATFAARNLA